MHHFRVGTNDYVLTTSTGPRELLFISRKDRESFNVLEQTKRSTDVEVINGSTLGHKLRRQIPCRSLYEYSLTLIRGFTKRVTIIETRRLFIERYQFGYPNSIKWAPFKVDGQIFFAPYKVAPLSTTDILLKHEPRRLNVAQAIESEVIETLTQETK